MSKTEPSTKKKPRVFLGRQVWIKHFKCYQQSGLTQNQYAEKHGLNPTTFKNWIARLKREDQSQAGTAPTFIPLKVASRPTVSQSKATVAQQGVHVRLPNGIECTFAPYHEPRSILPWIEYLRVLP